MKSRRGLFGLVLALGLIAALIIGISSGAADSADLEADSLAVIDAEEATQVTREQFDRTGEQLVGGGKIPKEDSDQYEDFVNAVMSQILQEQWFLAEADEQGVEVSDTEIDEKLAEIQRVSFGEDPEKSLEGFEQALTEGSFCTEEELADGPAGCPEARRQATLVILQEKLLPTTALAGETSADPVKLEEYKATISDDEVQTFYDENPVNFTQPASRDARVILAETEEKAQQAYELLSADDSEESWRKAAKRFSIDEASKDRGGLLESLIEGQGEPDRDAEIFAAEEGELIAPFEAERGWYVAQVVAVNEEGVQPLDDVLRDQIRGTIASQLQTDAIAEQEALTQRWTARTVCAEGYVVELCSNFVEPEPEPIPGQPAPPPTPEPPPVNSTKPIAPGTAVSEPTAVSQSQGGIDPATGVPLPAGGYNGAQQGGVQGPMPGNIETFIVPEADAAAPAAVPPGLPPGVPPTAVPPTAPQPAP